MTDVEVIDSLVAPKIGYIDVVLRGKHGVHVASLFRGEVYCSCPYFFFRRKVCKHIKYLCDKMLVDVEKILNGTERIGLRVSSSLKNIEDLFGSEAYNSNEILNIYGKHKVGKTLFCLQEAYNFAVNGLNVLYLDTEGGVEEMIRKKFPVFKERFGETKGKIYLNPKLKTIESLSHYLGWTVRVIPGKVSRDGKGGKMEFDILASHSPSDIERTVKEHNINAIIIDSISNPMRAFTTSRQQNFPARGDCYALIFRTLVTLQENFDVIVITTSHASFNPADQYAKFADSYGGSQLHHMAKRELYFDQRIGKNNLPAKGYENYRRVWMARGEDACWQKATVLEITDIGYVDVFDESIISSVFTDTEKSMLKK